MDMNMWAYTFSKMNDEDEVKGSLRLQIPDVNFFLQYIDKASIMDVLTFNVYGKKSVIELYNTIVNNAESRHAQIAFRHEHETKLLKDDLRKLEEELENSLDSVKAEEEKRDEMRDIVLSKVDTIDALTAKLEDANEMIKKLTAENSELKKKLKDNSKVVTKKNC